MIELFDIAFNEVIGIEGGYVNRGDDRGGETKYGITKRFYPEEDIAGLTLERAKVIYYEDYWKNKKLDLDRVAAFDPKIATKLFSLGVNQGIPTAAKFLQEALNLFSRNGMLFYRIKVDGWAGSATMGCLEKLKGYDKPLMYKCINGLQFMRYYDIVNNDRGQEINFPGWTRRL